MIEGLAGLSQDELNRLFAGSRDRPAREVRAFQFGKSARVAREHLRILEQVHAS